MPEVEPGILFVERQFGVLEVHGPTPADVARAGEAILAGIERQRPPINCGRGSCSAT